MHLSNEMILRRLSLATALATLLLIFAGGMVTSTGSGLSIRTWPLANGTLFPPMVGGAKYEATHRLIAGFDMSLIVLAVIATALWEGRRWVKVVACSTLALVLTQAMLGALTVRLLLPAWLSFSHGVVSQTIFLCTVVLAYSQSRELRDRKLAEEPRERRSVMTKMSMVFIALVYSQMIIGSVMRHTHSGLAIPDFPTVAGVWIPRFDSGALGWINTWRAAHAMEAVSMGQVGINFAHRFTAMIMLLAVAAINACAWSGSGEAWRRIRRTLLFVDVLLIAQIVLGAFVVWTAKEPLLTTVHVMSGAGILGLSILLLLQSAPVSWTGFREALGDERCRTTGTV